MAKRGKGARVKGHQYERSLVKEFKALGFEDAKTSRYASREKDDQVVDLVGTEPINVQAKALEKAPNFRKVLDSMPDDENYNTVFHKQSYKKDLVVMYKEDFYELLKRLK